MFCSHTPKFKYSQEHRLLLQSQTSSPDLLFWCLPDGCVKGTTQRSSRRDATCPQRAVKLLDGAVAKFEEVLAARPDAVPALQAAGRAYADMAALLPPDSAEAVAAHQVNILHILTTAYP